MPISLRQAARNRGNQGQLLPDAFPSLAEKRAQMRRGHLYLEAAAPGVGKSTKTLNECLLMQVPTLYFSMDTDAHTTCVRVLQARRLMDSELAENEVTASSGEARRALAEVHWIKFDFPSSPDTDEIAERVWAYAEMQGEWPHFIVVDNLGDVSFDEDENRGINRVMEDMAKLARFTGAAVKVLHHVTGEYEDGHTSIPQSGLRHKVAKKPAMVTTLNHGIGDALWVSVVKNRFGPADPSGHGVRAQLIARYEQMKVFDPMVRS